MRFVECEKLASELPQLRALIERCDSLLAKLDVNAVILAERWGNALNEDQHRVRSVLSALATAGLLVASASIECECGVLNPIGATSCSAGHRVKNPVESVAYSLSEAARSARTAQYDVASAARKTQQIAAEAANPRVPTQAAAPTARIGIITALPYEYAAMKIMLDAPREWHAQTRSGAQKYTVGDIPSRSGGTHEVVLTLLPDTGNGQAGARAQRLLQHVPSVTDIIMCGIAGGVPTLGVSEDDVRLGDIVYSSRSGVIQYVFGKDVAGKWEPRGRPLPPSADLSEMCRLLAAEAILGNRPWETYLERASLIENAKRPRDDEDAKGNPVGYPLDASRRIGYPRVFDGPIASADVLLKNADRRDALRDQYRVKAVEMEGSGIADATWAEKAGYLIVRGIVDYCDPDKGDRWHLYASIAAAAYVRALIESLGVPSIE